MNKKVSPVKGERNDQGLIEATTPMVSVVQPAQSTNPTLTLTDWDIDMCECNNSGCCFAVCCPGLALAQARTNMDGSDLCFNFCCLFPPVTLWLIHSAYGIPCTCEHICQMCCFAQFYINRVYQTTLNRGNPNRSFRGREHNNAKLNHSGCPDCVCSSCCLACAFPCCYTWYKLQQHLNMPCWVSCFVFPWTGQNLLRYQYGVAGSDCWDECFPGCMWWTFFGGSLPFLPIVAGTKGLLVVQSCETQMAKQASAGGVPTRRYLSTNAGTTFSPLGCGL